MFKRILVANRGEIAVRIIRTCREMDIESVAVYSDADANGLHIVAAEYAERLPGSAPAETYLNMGKILEVCKKYEVDALHPGYGFLAENAEFAQLCQDNGIKFIGPSPQAISDLGNKIKAKEIARAAGTPTVPGTDGPVNVKEAVGFCKEFGFPVMLKAVAGGGGRGMRMVEKAEDLEKSFKSCQNEAKGAFGSDEVFIERFVRNPKHIEFQIMADAYGNCIHLGERDCSVQRRHQKLIEEAPSPALDDAKRAEMGATAVNLAKAANYEGAGTVEFLLEKSGNYFFMEMNTRLQVEHPVTEMITGYDLVKRQILVAAGEPLDITQEDVKIHGWAFEVRINAEDPLKGFLPALGKLERYLPPAGLGVRLDGCAYEGYDIPREYDSMVAKLITYGSCRETAAKRMVRALDEFILTGVKTTIPFHRYVFTHPVFLSGNFDTGFIDKYFSDEQIAKMLQSSTEHDTAEHVAIAAALQYYLERTSLLKSNQAQDEAASRRWKTVHRLLNTSFMPR